MEIIEITEEVQIPGTNIVLEAGDKIKVLSEEMGRSSGYENPGEKFLVDLMYLRGYAFKNYNQHIVSLMDQAISLVSKVISSGVWEDEESDIYVGNRIDFLTEINVLQADANDGVRGIDDRTCNQVASLLKQVWSTIPR